MGSWALSWPLGGTAGRLIRFLEALEAIYSYLALSDLGNKIPIRHQWQCDVEGRIGRTGRFVGQLGAEAPASPRDLPPRALGQDRASLTMRCAVEWTSLHKGHSARQRPPGHRRGSRIIGCYVKRRRAPAVMRGTVIRRAAGELALLATRAAGRVGFRGLSRLKCGDCACSPQPAAFHIGRPTPRLGASISGYA